MVEWSIAAVLKTVETRVSGGSNPSLCAKRKDGYLPILSFVIQRLRGGIRGWEPFCESKTLCLTKLGIRHTRWQRTPLIMVERGVPLKARIPRPLLFCIGGVRETPHYRGFVRGGKHAGFFISAKLTPYRRRFDGFAINNPLSA